MLSLGYHQDVAHNFSFSSGSGLNFRIERPCQLFENKFTKFEFDIEEEDESMEEDNLMGEFCFGSKK